MLVIGTSAMVWPAADYISKARLHGARVAIVNPDAENETEMHKMNAGDFAFAGDAATILPLLLEPVMGISAEAEGAEKLDLYGSLDKTIFSCSRGYDATAINDGEDDEDDDNKQREPRKTAAVNEKERNE